MKAPRPKTPDTAFDLQVNGYGGVDFNGDDLTPESLHAACARLEADGVGGILATVTTEAPDVMARRLANLVAAREADPLARRIVAGVHIEGPFISPRDGYRGAHPPDAVRPADPDLMQRLLDAAGGLARIVTLAPECDAGLAVTRMLARQGIVASAGHCDPDLDTLRAAADAGLSMFTHVGNGCANTVARHDNIIQRALALRGRLWLCFIADGVHVPFFALANYLRAAGLEKTCVVTDAVTPAGLGPGVYRHGRFELRVGADRVARKTDGSLIGGAITLREAARNLVEHAGLSESDACRLVADNPRRAVGLA
jgi:N-acetylglucosamine-6-phosphate deacetylase